MKLTLGALVLIASLAIGSTAHAQYSLSVGGTTDPSVGTAFDLTVELDSTGGMDIAGWSFGLCHDPTFFDIVSVADGATTATVKAGAAPDFNEVAVLAGQGFTVGTVICFTGCAVLVPGSGYELYVATYEAGGTEGTGAVDFCSTLGNPPVDTVVVVNGASISPATSGATVGVVEPSFVFDYIAPDATASYNAGGTGSTTVQVSILEDAANAGFPNDTQGFSMGLSHDSAVLAVSSGPTPVLPFEPDFEGPSVLADGWTIGVVYSFTGASVLAFAAATPVIEVGYDISVTPGSGTVVTPLVWSNALGAPAVDNVVVVGGQSIDASFVDGSITLDEVTVPIFLRGDGNNDTRVDIGDGIFVLNYLFLGGPAGTCLAASDADGNGSVEMTDAVAIISYQLLMGPPLAAPFPECGEGSMSDDCAQSSCP